MTIYAMMRIKDEARWIERVIQAMLPVCEKIFVFDDHSSDGTPEICRSFEKVIFLPSPFEETLDEVRDKNYLVGELEKTAQRGDWILSIDGDEEIYPGDQESIRRLARGDGPNAYRFRILYLWDRPDQIRVDRWYSEYARPSFFRLSPGIRFGSKWGGGFHCGNVPSTKSLAPSNVRLLHYGYMYREDRIRKYNWYNSQEPVPAYEDGYKHFVIGDLFPANSVFKYAGPLKLQHLNIPGVR